MARDSLLLTLLISYVFQEMMRLLSSLCIILIQIGSFTSSLYVNNHTFYLTNSNDLRGIDDNILIDGLDYTVPARPNATQMLHVVVEPYGTDRPTELALLTFRSNLFQESISYYAVLVSQRRLREKPTEGCWNGTSWPSLPQWHPSDNGTSVYQATPPWWNPFTLPNQEFAQFTLGASLLSCKEYCNHALLPNTEYAVKIRAFTQTGFQDTGVLYFKTVNFPLTVLASCLLAAILCLAIAVYGIIKFRKELFGCVKNLGDMDSRTSASIFPTSRGKNGFISHYFEMVNSVGRLSSEFHLLGTLSSDMNTHMLHGLRNDNRRKNRYMNILPFDLSRVELTVVNDDPATDYINASFIRGCNKQVEYIACQGPMEDTCHDMWRMVLEQNVHLIVMLTQLYEQGREKCCRYFPDHFHHSLTFSDIKVTCLEVESKDGLTTRSLSVIRGSRSAIVSHIQFTDWPDNDVPGSSEPIIALCDKMNGLSHNSGCTVVHCSAGVGRTGTLLATHILLQAVKNNQKLNVFTTVLELRQQRVGMVATEGQYQYIYKCITDYLLKNKHPRLSRDKRFSII